MPRTIKVVRRGSSNISTARLEIAQAQLMRARICNIEAQVSFGFLQKLIREVIKHRRSDNALAKEIEHLFYAKGDTLPTTDSLELIESIPDDAIVEIADVRDTTVPLVEEFYPYTPHDDDELTIPEGWAGPPDFEEYDELDDLPDHIDLDDDDEDEVEVEQVAKVKRRSVLNGKNPRHQYWAGGIDMKRVMVAVVLGLIFFSGTVLFVS